MKKTLLSLIFVLFLASPVYASTNQPQLDQLASVITSLQSIVDSLQNLVSTSFQSVSTNFSANSSSQLAALDGSGSGLVGWWKFDEGSGTIAADSSGNSNTGTLMPATTPPSWTTGQLGQALSFNGLNYIMGTKVLSIGVSAITFSAWVFPRSNGPTGYGVVISNGYAYLATGGPSSTRWIFSHNYGATSGSAGNNSITLNKWQHVVVVRKSSGLITFYINGNQIGTADQNIGVAADGNNAWRIGSRADGNYFDGLIDEVRVYDRDLSASEVSQLYTLGNEVSNGSPATYSLSITNAGNGTVSSNPAGLNCGSTCSISGITSGATYTLTAAPDVNYSSSWSGCSPSANNDTCTVVVNGNTTVTVIFASASSPAPVITSVSASNITATGATLTWTTDQLSDSQADYGTTASYGNSTAIGTTLSTSHSITLSGLTANTLYHYRVYSKNASGVITRSGDNTFTTSQQVSQASGNIYIAQNAQGSNSGADCDNAHSVAWLNTYGSWGTGMGQIGPATTVHLCGTISSFLNIRGSGSPGSPITIFFENNAKLSSPTWTSSSIIYMSNKNWITIDGGTNGVVEATDNGTGVQYGGNFNNQKGFNAVYGENLSHVTIQNLNIRNLYVRKPSSLDPVLSGSSSVMCGGIIIIIGSDIIVRNNRISDAGELIGINWGAGATNITVDNNILLNTNHAITIANNSAGGSLTNLTISRNKIDGLDVWEGGENFHRNGLFLFTNYVDSTITNIYVYNNHVGPGINPQTGTAGTGGLDNQRPLAPGMFKNVYVFNNIADLKAPLKWSQAFIGIAGENSLIANNTVVGWSDSSGCYGGPGIAVGGIGGRAEAYNNLVNCTGSMMVHSVYEGYPFTNVLSDYNLFNNEGFKRYASFLTLVNTKGGWDTAINNAWYEFATWQASLTSNRDPHSLNIDPQLVNANTSNGDYHLQSTSPARNAGINLTSYCTIIPQLCFDYDNNPRPSTGPWTIGAYEYVSGGAPTPVNGSCSITINQCATGSFSDTTDTSTNYLWNCTGSNGGTTASCSLAIPPAPDTTSPTIIITAPVAGATVSGSVTMSSTATDPAVSGQTTSGMAAVQFKLDNSPLGPELTTAPYSGTWNTLSITNGSHTLLATARDLAGNRSTSTPITIIVSNVTTTTPINGSCGTNLNTCSSGTSSNATNTGTSYLWDCTGSSGGTNVNCSLAIPATPTAPPAPVVTTPSTGGGGGSPSTPTPALVPFVPTVLQSTATAIPGGTGTTTCPATLPASSSPSLNSNRSTLNPVSFLLNPGSRSSNVTNLQNFLISQNLLSPDSATGYYGSLTTKAVQAFQLKYGITTVGTPSTTGYGVVGSKTRAKINQMIQDSRFMIQEGGTGTPLPQTVTGQANSNCIQPTMTREQLVAYIRAKITELQKQLVVLLQELVKAKLAEMGR